LHFLYSSLLFPFIHLLISSVFHGIVGIKVQILSNNCGCEVDCIHQSKYCVVSLLN
ncbi:hypothetical protein K445DRAFT_371760, partial [Daldinia sp. EC12]